MERTLNLPRNALSEKEIKDFERRIKVIKLLRVGERWQKIKEKTGAHLQTIAIIAKRLKKQKQNQKALTVRQKKPIFIFGQSVE